MAYVMSRREGDVGQTIRTVGRLAEMLMELRNEYERKPRPDTTAQIERRLSELIALRDELRAHQLRDKVPVA